MGAARWERTESGQDDAQGAAGFVDPVSAADRPANEAIRSWLVRGVHTFAIDPRRLGGRGLARRVLGEDRRLAPGVVGGWLEMISALQRHTIHNALAHLSPEERQVVTLAYLEGHTNARIAAMLGVSVSTVRRRLWLALEHLDGYLRRAGTWVSAMLLLGLLSAAAQAARVGRVASRTASADWPHKLAAAVAVSTLTVGGIGLAAAGLHSARSKPPVAGAPAHSAPIPFGATSLGSIRGLPLNPGPGGPATAADPAPLPPTHKSTTKLADTSPASTGKAADADTDGDDSDQDEGAPVEQDQRGHDASPSHHPGRDPHEADR